MSEEPNFSSREKSSDTRFLSPILLSSTLKSSANFRGRVVLYATTLLVVVGYFLFKTSRPISLQPVFLHTDRIERIEWPENHASLVLKDKKWRVEHKSWGSALADSGKVLELLQNIKETRGIQISQTPKGFSLVGEMRIAQRTLRFYHSGTDAVVESGSQRYFLPGFSVDRLFPDPANLIQGNPFHFEVSKIHEIILPVLTADGEKQYRIQKNPFYYYITGSQNHLVNYNSVVAILKNIQDVSFRRLLLPPSNFPEKANFVLSSPQRTWKMARFLGSCPEGETAWVVDNQEIQAGCIPDRFMSKLVPSLPTLLELRLLPPPPDGTSWTRIRVRVDDHDVIDVQKTSAHWAFTDGIPADDVFCENILQAWQNTAILGLVNPEPAEILRKTVIVSNGDVEFSIALYESAGHWYAQRGQEGRRARIPENFATWVVADRTGWADRRVFSSGCQKIVRVVGTFREVFAWETPPEGSPLWRVLEPLDLPYPTQLETRIQDFCNLRMQPVRENEIRPMLEPETAWVRWEVTDTKNQITVLVVRPDGIVVRQAPNGEQHFLKPDLQALQWLTAPWHEGLLPSWNLKHAKNIEMRLSANRDIRISFHDPHWLWTEGDKKRILTENQVQKFLNEMQKTLEQAIPVDLLSTTDCPVRLLFSSDVGLPLEYCVETIDEQKRVSRSGMVGHARVNPDFPEALLPVFP